MGHKFTELTFTENVKAAQELNGSRRAYSRIAGGETHHDVLGANEAAFISARDSFYMATVSETGWPYLQHRGGSPGFLKVLDEKTVGFLDFRGNRQYISLGNLQSNSRVSLFLMDYPNRARLKILGQVTIVAADDAEAMRKLVLPGSATRVERGFLITVEAFDWNCSQYITPRFTLAEIEASPEPLEKRVTTPD